MRFILTILLLSSIYPIFAQRIGVNDLDETVLGIILYGNATYLVTPKGYLNVVEEDINTKYENYYREIYGDSTIVNPNRVITPANDSSLMNFIVPFIGIGSENEYMNEIPEGLTLVDFISMNEKGEFVFRRGIYGLINGMISDYKNE